MVWAEEEWGEAIRLMSTATRAQFQEEEEVQLQLAALSLRQRHLQRLQLPHLKALRLRPKLETNDDESEKTCQHPHIREVHRPIPSGRKA